MEQNSLISNGLNISHHLPILLQTSCIANNFDLIHLARSKFLKKFSWFNLTNFESQILWNLYNSFDYLALENTGFSINCLAFFFSRSFRHVCKTVGALCVVIFNNFSWCCINCTTVVYKRIWAFSIQIFCHNLFFFLLEPWLT